MIPRSVVSYNRRHSLLFDKEMQTDRTKHVIITRPTGSGITLADLKGLPPKSQTTPFRAALHLQPRVDLSPRPILTTLEHPLVL